MQPRNLVLQQNVRRADAVDVDHGLERGDITWIGQRQCERHQRGIAGFVLQQPADKRCQRSGHRAPASAAMIVRQTQQHAGHQALSGVPAIDRVAVVRGEERQIVLVMVVNNFHRRGEPAQQRRHGRHGNIDEPKQLAALRHVQYSCRCADAGFAGKAQRKITTVAIEQTDGERDMERLFA